MLVAINCVVKSDTCLPARFQWFHSASLNLDWRSQGPLLAYFVPRATKKAEQFKVSLLIIPRNTGLFTLDEARCYCLVPVETLNSIHRFLWNIVLPIDFASSSVAAV